MRLLEGAITVEQVIVWTKYGLHGGTESRSGWMRISAAQEYTDGVMLQ